MERNRTQVGGNHYDKRMQPIEYIEANDLRFDEGSVVKYITRHKEKNGLEDLLKCIHNVMFTMQRVYKISPEVTKEVMALLKERLL